MKFIVLTDYSSRIVEAEDIEDAITDSYDNHCGYDHIKAVVRIDEE